MYLNGVLETQLVVGSFTPQFNSIQHAALATALNSSGGAGGAFLGALDEARIWNVARSAVDIQSTMAGPLPTAPGLIGRWGLDDGAGLSAIDSSGSGVTGTLRNGAAWTSGTPFVSTPVPPGDYGLRLRGTTGAADHVALGPGLGASTFTVETWFKRDPIQASVATTTGSGGLPTVVPLVTKGRNDGEANNLDLNYFLGLSGNVLAADFEEGASGPSPGTNHPLSGTTPILLNQWYHAAVTYDGVTLQLYLNGALEAAATIGRPARADSIEQAAIGTALNSTGVAAGFFAGTVDEARIWNYARTPTQVASGKDREIAAANGLLGRWGFTECCTARDSSGQNANGTLFGSAWTWTAGAPFTAAVNAAPVAARGRRQVRHASRSRAALRIVHRRQPQQHAGDDTVEQDERSGDRGVPDAYRLVDHRQFLGCRDVRADARGE